MFDRITRDANGRTRYHYVIADFLCRRLAGEPTPGGDVSDIALAAEDDLERFDLTPETLAVVRAGLAAATVPAGD